MKAPEWIRDKLQVMAIEADDMLGSCDMAEDDYRDYLEVARNYMANAAEVIARLMAELEQAKQERDAAVGCLRGWCDRCKHFRVTHNGCTYDYACDFEDCQIAADKPRWEWRGVQEESK